MAEPIVSERSSVLKSVIRSAWILGVLSTGFGIQLFVRYGLLNRLGEWKKPFEVLAVFGWVIPGLIIVASAIYLRRHEPWAVSMAKFTSLWQILIAFGFLFGQIFLWSPMSAVPLVMNLAWTAALVQFFWQLFPAGKAARIVRAEEWRGFEVMDSDSAPLPKPVIMDGE